MKKTTLTILAFMLALTVVAQPLYVGTYNLRNQNDGDARNGNGWTHRCQVICDMLNFEQPDIFGTQEGLIGQLRDMKKALNGYDYIGVGRDDGKIDGEHSAIFYRTDKFKLLDHGDFWLNETPNVPKLGWDAACVRICSWGKFKDKKTKLKFYYFNLHMDHVGIVARREGAKLVVQKIKEIAGEKAAVILTGDFNVDQTNEIYGIFTGEGKLNDSYVIARQRFCENGTFNAFNSDLKTNSRIDHIFLTPGFEVSNYGVLTNCYWTEDKNAEATHEGDSPSELRFKRFTRRTPSDHYLVLARINYRK